MHSEKHLTEQHRDQRRDQRRECDQSDQNPSILVEPSSPVIAFQASTNDKIENASQHPPTSASANVSPHWLAREILKRTDVSNGEICMFQYPTTFRDFGIGMNGGGGNFIRRHCIRDIIARNTHSTLNAMDAVDRNKCFHVLNENDLRHALELILNGHFISGRNNANNNENMDIDDPIDLEGSYEEPQLMQPSFMQHASQESRDQITRLQFSWYDFQSFPRDIVGQAFANLQHVDIRQNANLNCIESIAQLPHLVSLNLSDCPNVRSLVPLADNLHSATSHQQDTGADSILHMAGATDVEHEPVFQQKRTSNLRHLWVRGCNLSGMTRDDWSLVFDALAESTGPLERLTLSRNKMSYLHGGIGKLKSLAYLFVEDNDGAEMASDVQSRRGFELPDELGSLACLRFASFSGNNITRLPRTLGRLNDDCDIHLHRNPNLKYPPLKFHKSVKMMRTFFHKERMSLFIGASLFMPHMKRGQIRANERLYQPGGSGYLTSKKRFEDIVRVYEWLQAV